jgi:hypothetical protein
MPGLMPSLGGSSMEKPAHPHLGFPGRHDHGARQLCPSAGADLKRPRSHDPEAAEPLKETVGGATQHVSSPTRDPSNGW